MDTKAIETKCHNRQNRPYTKCQRPQNVIESKFNKNKFHQHKMSQTQNILDKKFHRHKKTQKNEIIYTRNTILFKKNSYIREFLINQKINVIMQYQAESTKCDSDQ